MLARSTAWRHGDGPDLDEGDVDEQHVPVADEEVGRLDVAVGEPGVPEPAHDQQALVDHLVVDVARHRSPRAPSKNSVTRRYSRSGVSSTIPYDCAVGMPTSWSSRAA